MGQFFAVRERIVSHTGVDQEAQKEPLIEATRIASGVTDRWAAQQHSERRQVEATRIASGVTDLRRLNPRFFAYRSAVNTNTGDHQSTR